MLLSRRHLTLGAVPVMEKCGPFHRLLSSGWWCINYWWWLSTRTWLRLWPCLSHPKLTVLWQKVPHSGCYWERGLPWSWSTMVLRHGWWLFILFLWDKLERKSLRWNLVDSSVNPAHHQHCLGTMLTMTDTQVLTPEPLKCWREKRIYYFTWFLHVISKVYSVEKLLI